MEHLIDEQSAGRLRSFLAADGGRRAPWAIVGLGVAVALVVGALLAFLTPIGGVAVLVVGVGALLMLRDVRWGIFALLGVVCLLPFASLPFKIGFTPTFLDLVLGALYAVWGMRLITRRQDDFVLTPVGLPVAIFVVLALFSFVRGLAHARPSANDLRTFAEVLMGFGLFFLVVNNVRDEPLLRQVTAVAILAGAAEGAIGILLYVLPQVWALRLLNPLGRLGYPVGPGAFRYIADDPERPMRAIGTSVDPNILGALLVIVMAIAAAQFFARRPALPRAVLGAAIACMGLCLFLTYSRSSMAGAVAAVGAIALLKYRRLFLVLAVVALLLLVLPQTQEYVAHFVQGIEIRDLATKMRMGEYKDAFKLIQRYPWLGVGFVGTPDIDLYLGIASIYLTLAAQMGVVGLAAFLLAMAAFGLYWYRAWRECHAASLCCSRRIRDSAAASVTCGSLCRSRRIRDSAAASVTYAMADSPLAPYLLGSGAAIGGSLIAGVLDHTLLTYPHAVALFWLTLGLGAVAARITAP